ncbi:hypothetical protein JX265_001625 [Neoarthrinium moseri]|uniref:Enoyl reductase (ER) domain-containing protein n=1 Tax=Neoarthrinium moseri TaxID=1658444 RepID=A0A9Q0AQV4_9PEZI|nr:uncharacterized protein JN550_004020 [Neoarthrinium moseri]KAI1872301.1 hypothetical protein JN550_004020 [Neoarthrinium moseri]KAI1880004.1 hypothetical protein JX265_001625 [Neoarthrinium moseri]
MGCDVAGTVIEVGSNVTRFKAGDRVLAFATGMEEKHNTSVMGGYQLYTVVQENMASMIPDLLEFEMAAVVPLAMSTAACGLFERSQLALRHPAVGGNSEKIKEILILWGGSTSVGCNAIQLAVAAGYEVVTTCSPRNFDLVKSLGASAAFDYHSETLVEDIVKKCKGRLVAGAMSIGNGGAERCTDILDASIPVRMWTFLSFLVRMWFKKRATGVRSKFVWGGSLEFNEVSKAVFEDYLPEALRRGQYICAPNAEIIGNELESIQSGLDMLKKGAVSAKKLVVKF